MIRAQCGWHKQTNKLNWNRYMTSALRIRIVYYNLCQINIDARNREEICAKNPFFNSGERHEKQVKKKNEQGKKNNQIKNRDTKWFTI